MKQLKFLAALFAGMFFLVSCNSGGDKKSDNTGADSTAVQNQPTTSSGPTRLMTITHKVADFEKWKPAYEAHDSVRRGYGVHNYVIARGIDDSNMILVGLVIEDVEKAKQFASLPDLKETMKKAGVMEPVMFDYIEVIVNDTTAIQQTVRLMVKHRVKDWDAWKKVFDSHKQVRMENGLTDRVIGYTIGDKQKVTVVFAVADVSKAKAFMVSKDLKDNMDEAGVLEPPTFFFYRIVVRY